MRRKDFLAGGLRPPGLLGVAPIDPFQKAGRLGSRQRNDALFGGRPDETASVQTLGVQGKPDPIMPKALNQGPAAAPENEDVAFKGLPLEVLLNKQGEPWHPLAHIGVAGGDPDTRRPWRGDHRRAPRAALTSAGDAFWPMVTVAPPENTTTIPPPLTLIGAAASPRITAGTNPAFG